MAVVALTSGMGTGVKYVAEKVARQLGLELVHREVLPLGHDFPNVGVEAGVACGRWDAGLGWLKEAGCVEGLSNLEDICLLAQRGNVLICGATPLHFLSGVAHVTKVRVRTTMALRVRRIMACMGTDESNAALEKILQSDRMQSDVLRRLFGIQDFEQPSLYDAVIDTGREPADHCANQIVNLVDEIVRNNARSALDSLIEDVKDVRIELARHSTRARG